MTIEYITGNNEEQNVIENESQYDEHIFRQIVDNIHEVLFLISPDWQTVYYISPSYEDVWGKTCESLLQKPLSWMDSLHPDDRSKVLHFIDEKAQGDLDDITFPEYRVVRPDGSLRWVSARGFPIRNKKGEIYRIAGIAADITRQKEKEEELTLSEERLKMVLDGSRQGFWDWNIETGEVLRNERWAQMLGYESIKEFESNTNTWTDNIHPDDRDAAWAAINDHLEGRTLFYKIEYRMLTKNGKVKWILDQAKIVQRDTDGRPLRMSGTHSDITEQKEAEAKNLEQANLLELFYTHTHDCIVLLDKIFNFIRVNEAYAKACARDVSEFPGHNHFEFYPSELIKTFEKVVKTKEPFHVFARPFEFPDHPDWGVTYWDLTLIPILDSTDEVELLLFTLKDVTGRELAVQEKELLQKQLQKAQKMESIGQLTGGIAHEFNNMLASIIGFSELSISQFATDPYSKLSQYLHNILHAGKRGRDLVTKMLAFGRSIPGEPQSVNGELVVSEVTELLSSTLPSSITFSAHIAEDVPSLRCNSLQLHQVITNLVINAHHAIGKHGKIELKLQGPDHVESVCSSCHQHISGEFIEVSVRDDGHGIPEEQINNIFEPFFTTKEVGKGSGMGLSMVDGIIHTCNGHILVESNVDAGSNFRLLFMPASATSDNKSESPAEETSSASVNANQSIIVVDDEAGITGYLTELLNGFGYQVRAFNDPLAALEAIKSESTPIDLVITDQTMPNLTGVEFTEELLSLYPNLPVILCTGYSESIDEDGAKRLGIAELLKKPVSSGQLLRSIAVLLNDKNSQRSRTS